MHIRTNSHHGGASLGGCLRPRGPRIGSDGPAKLQPAKRAAEFNYHDRTYLAGLRLPSRPVQSKDRQHLPRGPSFATARTADVASSSQTKRSQQLLPTAEQVVQMFARAPSSFFQLVDEKLARHDESTDLPCDHRPDDSNRQPPETMQYTQRQNDEWTGPKISRGVIDKDADRESSHSSASTSVAPELWQGAEARMQTHAFSPPESDDVESPAVALTSNPSDGDSAGEETKMPMTWKEKWDKTRSMILVNVLAAVYGSSNVANGIAAEADPSLPVSLASLVRFTSALVFFAPALAAALKKKDAGILRAGAELAGMSFAEMLADTYNPTSSGSSTSATLLFGFTLAFASVMQLCAGRHSGFTTTRLATLAAISGMGLLGEEGSGWQGISWPHMDDWWGMALSIIFAVHIFRSQVHAGRFDPLHLSAVQCGMLALLSLGWEAFNSLGPAVLRSHELLAQVQSLPWAPLVYSGLVCFGLCSWAELHGLRSVHASTITLIYTTIPVWSAVLSFFAHREVPNCMEPSMIGAAVILLTSIYAQFTARSERTEPGAESQSDSTHSAPNDKEAAFKECSTSDDDGAETKWQPPSTSSKEISALQEALLTSQLKFPYYATQAKTLLTDVKIKLGAVKFVLFPTVSSGLATSTIRSASSPSSMDPAGGSVAPVPGLDVHVSNALPQSAAQLDALDKSSLHVIAAHTPPAAISTHGSDIAVASTGNTMLAHTYADLSSAVVMVGSKIVLGCEGAEDTATVLESLGRSAVENTAHAIATSSPAAAAVALDVEQQMTRVPSLILGENSTLSFLANGAEQVFDFLIQHSSMLVHH